MDDAVERIVRVGLNCAASVGDGFEVAVGVVSVVSWGGFLWLRRAGAAARGVVREGSGLTALGDGKQVSRGAPGVAGRDV